MQHFGIFCFIISTNIKITEMQKKICTVYRKGAVTDWMSQKLLFSQPNIFTPEAIRPKTLFSN